MANIDETTAGVYLHRARQFAAGLELLRDDLRSYGSAAALLAVHSAISYADAVEIKLSGKVTKGDDHRQKVTALKKACSKAGVSDAGAAQLQKLLGAKYDIAYGDGGSVGEERAAAICEAARRFQTWAERIRVTGRGGEPWR
jgi:hypothetical protein